MASHLLHFQWSAIRVCKAKPYQKLRDTLLGRELSSLRIHLQSQSNVDRGALSASEFGAWKEPPEIQIRKVEIRPEKFVRDA